MAATKQTDGGGGWVNASKPNPTKRKRRAERTGQTIEEAVLDLVLEFQLLTGARLLALVKSRAALEEKHAGHFLCPVCRSGRLAWSIAESNGHARILCDRIAPDGFPCINIME